MGFGLGGLEQEQREHPPRPWAEGRRARDMVAASRPGASEAVARRAKGEAAAKAAALVAVLLLLMLEEVLPAVLASVTADAWTRAPVQGKAQTCEEQACLGRCHLLA